MPGTRYIVPGTNLVFFWPRRLTPTTRPEPPTRTLWGDLGLEAVAWEGSRLFRPEGDAVHGGRAFQNPHTRVYIHFFRTLADTWDKPRTEECSWNVLRALMYGNICVRSAGIVARI